MARLTQKQKGILLMIFSEMCIRDRERGNFFISFSFLYSVSIRAAGSPPGQKPCPLFIKGAERAQALDGAHQALLCFGRLPALAARRRSGHLRCSGDGGAQGVVQCLSLIHI